MPPADAQEEYLEALTRFMEEDIPFNRHLGVQVERLVPGEVTLRLPFREAYVGDPSRPALHGGTISMLADTAGGAAVFSSGQPGDRVSTIDLRIDYLRPGALTDLVAEGRVVRLGNKVGVSRIQLWQAATEGNRSDEAPDLGEVGRRLIAEGTGVYSIRRG